MIKKIRSVTCVGSGLIGQGWATLFSAAGFQVILQDLSENQLKNAQTQISLNLSQMQEQGHLRLRTADESYDLISTTLDLSTAVSNSDYVLESVPDNYAVKKGVFEQLDRLAPSDTILASSSSSLLMSEIQTVVKKPERCIVAHPFLPVHLIPLVEVIGGNQTTLETADITCQLMKTIGKSPVYIRKEVPGYIVNRIQTAIFREAADLVANGVATAAEVDQAFCTGIGMRDPFIGPLLRAHLTADGIENFFDHYSSANQIRLKSMATWKSFSPQLRDTVVKSVNEMPIVQNTPLKKIKAWRDDMLSDILKLKRENQL